jgi:serine/threonine-protein kinase RIM15
MLVAHTGRQSVNDFSPSSSDNEDTKSSALLRVRKRRQSARRPASFSLQGADSFSRPTFQEVDVLYCEPIPIVRHSIARILERLGCIVVAVADGDELVRRATGKVKFDIIFTALRLPKVEAPDAVKLIRYTSGVNSNTPVVAITGYAKEAQQAKCFDEVLEKPTNSNEVRNCLVEFCNWGPLLTSSQDAVNDEAIESDTERL